MSAWPVSTLFTHTFGASSESPQSSGVQEQTDVSEKITEFSQNVQNIDIDLESLASGITDTSTNDKPVNTLPQTSLSEFSINVPAINLQKEITANVDPTDKDEYLSVIEETIAHGLYTALPNSPGGNTYLFAHSKNSSNGETPDGGWFTRIDELKTGDTITITYKGEKYLYAVVTSEIVDPEETDVYTPESPFGERRSLTLQTCYPRGTTEKRIIVTAIEK